MYKSLLTAYHVTKILPPYRKSWTLNTMVTAVFRPEAELTLFLLMRTKEIAKSLVKYIPIEEILPVIGNRGRTVTSFVGIRYSMHDLLSGLNNYA